jgi:hypothetical protein
MMHDILGLVAMILNGLFLLTLQVTARVTDIHITVVFYNEERSEKEKTRTLMKCVRAGPQASNSGIEYNAISQEQI